MSSQTVFEAGEIGGLFNERRKGVVNTIANEVPDYLLNVSIEDYVAYHVERNLFDPPVLQVEDRYIDEEEEVAVDIRFDRRYHVWSKDRPVYKPGVGITYHVPIEGDSTLIRYRSGYYIDWRGAPRVVVKGNELLFRYDKHDPEPDEFQADFQHDLNLVRRGLEPLTYAINRFNEALPALIREQTDARRAILLKNRKLVAALKVPMRRRTERSGTFSVPVTRRKLVISKPQANTTPFAPEPTLADVEYDHILGVARHMSLVFERSPRVLMTMDEEMIRDLFLVALNSHYEGAATGETFNFNGKADILIRYEDHNVFIAECKIWDGPKKLAETVDQILRYTSWRDTKTAIFLFNRDRQLSTVLQRVPQTIEAHPNFKRRLDCPDETTFRCRLHHLDDENRELTLTVLVFEVPGSALT